MSGETKLTIELDTTQVLKNYDGEPLIYDTKDGNPLTIGRLSCDMLLKEDGAERLPGTEKVARFELAQRIHSADVVKLTPEEWTKIKGIIGKDCFPHICAPAWLALETAKASQNGGAE